jgi:predicted O-linked N-acetylglucosamine transferase (SPINDLY family)
MFSLFKSKIPKEPAALADLAGKLAQARAFGEQGRSAEAAALCDEILQANSGHVDALLLAGEIAARQGDLRRAISLYTKVSELRPESGFAHFMLGNLLVGCGKLEAALGSYDRAAALDTGAAEVFGNRGVVLERLDRLDAALASFAQALTLDPGNALTHYNRAALLSRLGRREEALASYEQAIAFRPDYAEAHFNRGTLLKDLQRRGEALASYDEAIRCNACFAAAHGYRGALLYDDEQWDAALASYNRAIELDAGYAEAYYNRGVLLQRQKRLGPAMADFEKAIELIPHYAEAHMNRGALLYAERRLEEALASFDEAIMLDPDYTQAHFNRALLLLECKRWEAARASCDRVLELAPYFRGVLGMRTLAKMMICDWGDFEADVERLTDGVSSDRAVSAPLPILTYLDRADLHHRSARIWARAECAVDSPLPMIGTRPTVEKIRIGYFSADFRLHIVALVMAAVFETHDRSKFELIAFSLGTPTHDDMEGRLKRAFDRFIDVSGMADEEVALLARSLEIDIAVDLGGYTTGCRPRVFALRAAPIQVNFLGYPGTMGAPFMDYLIADRTVIPEALQRHYSEKIVYLPHSFLPNGSTREISARPLTRRQFDLPPEGFVFCSFNSCHKITPGVFGGWMRILGRVPRSVLWFSQTNPIAAVNLRRAAMQQGIAADRLIFAEHMASLSDHLARHALGDLLLDTLPYNAHATAMDALWSGMPVLTRIGEGFAGRVAASLLETIRLPELITTTVEQYEDLAVELATNPERLATIRRTLAENRITAPLFDIRKFTRHLEAAYVAVHERYHAGSNADHISVIGEPR